LILFGTRSRWPSISSVHDGEAPARTVVVKKPMNGFLSGIPTGIPVDPSGRISTIQFSIMRRPSLPVSTIGYTTKTRSSGVT
jgi:hypothetical protein